jgi:hypothetical protein
MVLKLSLARRTLDNVTTVMVSFNGFKNSLDRIAKSNGESKGITTQDFERLVRSLPNEDLTVSDIDKDVESS